MPINLNNSIPNDVECFKTINFTSNCDFVNDYINKFDDRNLKKYTTTEIPGIVMLGMCLAHLATSIECF